VKQLCQFCKKPLREGDRFQMSFGHLSISINGQSHVSEQRGNAALTLAGLATLVRHEDLILVCHCAPKACHAQIIARAVKWYAERCQ
jgi:hypothetical protein